MVAARRWSLACPTTPTVPRTRSAPRNLAASRCGHSVFEDVASTTEAHAERSWRTGFASGAKDADAASACTILEEVLRNSHDDFSIGPLLASALCSTPRPL